MADPNYSNFEIPSIAEIGRALQALSAASLTAFDPFTPGSFCPGQCADITNANADYINLVQAINNAWPGNETIETWLNAYDNGVANVPTEDQIQRAIEILQQGFWDFDKPSPPAPEAVRTTLRRCNCCPIFGPRLASTPATTRRPVTSQETSHRWRIHLVPSSWPRTGPGCWAPSISRLSRRTGPQRWPGSVCNHASGVAIDPRTQGTGTDLHLAVGWPPADADAGLAQRPIGSTQTINPRYWTNRVTRCMQQRRM
jgi:hypothetical protein